MTKKIFTYSLAVAAMLASCNDDFQNIESNVAEGGKGKLVEAGLLGVTPTANEAATRAFNPVGGFVWMPEAVDPASGSLTAQRLNQKVGLCWTGVNTGNAQYGAIDAAGTNVYTNYEYEHVGWMFSTAAELDFDECTGELINGAYIVGEGTPEAEFNGSYATGLRWNKYYYGAQEGKKYGTSDALNLGSGVFKTDNASVFEGQYIVYFPYTDKFTKGAIVANTPDKFEAYSHDVDHFAESSKYGFQVGYINHYEGGNRSTNFQTENYTNYLQIKDASITINDTKIKTVIVYSPTQGIIYEACIDAASIISARQAGDITKVKQVEPEKNKVTNAVYANLVEGGDIATISSGETLCLLPMIPQTVDDLVVILINENDKSQYYSIGQTELVAGQVTKVNVAIHDNPWKNEYYAVDEPTFASALNKINTNGSDDADPAANVITILRDIDMHSGNDTKYATTGQISVAKNITVKADQYNASAKITITAGDGWYTTRTIEATAADKTLTVNVPVVVEGYGCCASDAAVLNIGGADDTYKDNVIFGKDVTNYGTTNVGNAGITTVLFKGNVNNIWDTDYAQAQGYSKGSKERNLITDAAKLNFNANLAANVQSITIEGKLTNEGTVTVNSNYALGSANTEGNRTLKAVINSIDNIGVLVPGKTKAESDADIIGGDIKISKNAIVSVPTTIDNKNIWSYIYVAGQGNSDTTDGRLDVKTAGSSANKGTIENDGVINLLGGSLDNTAGLFIDNLTGQVGGIPVDNGSAPADYVTYFYKGIEGENDYMTDLKSGIFVAKTATNDRMAFIINDAVESKSAVVIEVVGVEATPGYYNFSMPIYKGKDLRNYDVRINAATEIPFIAAETNTAGQYIATKSVGHCLDIYSDLKLGSSNALNVEKNVFVREGNTLNLTANIAEFNIGKDLTVEATATVNTVLKTANTVSELNVMNVMNDIKNYGDINSKRNFTVGRDFRIYKTGNLDSDGIENGTPNVVTRDFVLAGKAAFARYTTTIVKGTFTSGSESQFVREGLGSSDVYRATVNVGTLGTTAGSATGGWPTQM